MDDIPVVQLRVFRINGPDGPQYVDLIKEGPGGVLLVSQHGGGFVVRVKAADAVEVDLKEAHGELKKGKVSLDDEGGPWEAWLFPGERWNGWGCPSFEKAAADQVIEHLNKAAGNPDFVLSYYDETRDVYVTSQQSGLPPEEDLETWSGEDLMTPEGPVRVYPIGSHGWCWWVDEE